MIVRYLSALFFIAFTSTLLTWAQEKNVKPETHSIDSIFRQQMDSTIILETKNSWFHGKDALIVSKKGDTISCFSYYINIMDITKQRSGLPAALSKLIFRQVYWDFSQDIAVSPYLEVVHLSSDNTKQIWNTIRQLKLGQLADDKVDGYGCPIDSSSKQVGIYDVDEYILKLITKDDIKIRNFYAPQFFEEHCPGRKGRQDFLALYQLLSKHLRPIEKKH